MKQFKRCVALLLAGIFLAALLTSCVKKENDAPDGMMVASAAGADYLLYVPTTWNTNTFYGISGAYRDATAQSTVSVQRYSSAGYSVGDDISGRKMYWTVVCLPQIQIRAVNGEVTPYTADEAHAAHSFFLGGAPAEYYHVTALVPTREGERQTLHFVYVIAERNGYFYVLSYLGTEAAYQLSESDLDKIIAEFKFSETPYTPSQTAWKPANVKDVPDGMKIACSDEVAYRFFAPADWDVDAYQRVFAAVEPNDRSNVSVVAYLPVESGMSVSEFHKMTTDLMARVSGEGAYEAVAEKESTLGGVAAMDYEFRYTVGGTSYHYRQLVATYRGMFYTMTYTATEAHYAEHLADFEKMAAELIFR
ncbi:MAG: DUF1795 domain-containing protein [Ruminococcaceae bacterium]|nr:DUF1795 domain-containing protein [Oscillospiraceae bacterium]